MVAEVDYFKIRSLFILLYIHYHTHKLIDLDNLALGENLAVHRKNVDPTSSPFVKIQTGLRFTRVMALTREVPHRAVHLQICKEGY